MMPSDEPVPLQRTPEGTQTSEGTYGERPAAATTAEGDDRPRQVSDRGKQHFRELKKLLVNIERFIPEDTPEAAADAAPIQDRKRPPAARAVPTLVTIKRAAKTTAIGLVRIMSFISAPDL